MGKLRFSASRGSLGAPLVALRMPLIALLCIAAIAMPGCSGCPQVVRPRDAADAEKTDEEKERDEAGNDRNKEDITIGRLMTLPHDEQTAALNLVKPGHWIGAYQELTANNFDFQGELISRTVDGNGQPIDVENTAYTMRFRQSAALPEGKKRYVGVSYYVPRSEARENYRLLVDNSLIDRRSGRQIGASRDRTTILPDYQFLLLVLSEQPTQFAYLKTLDSVEPPGDEFSDTNILHYRVLTPDLEKLVPLADSALAWTTVAHVVWDGLDPNKLTPQQQDAMLDWLHLGGQLVVVAPTSLDRLRGSFLQPFLPATSEGTRELTQEEMNPLSERFTLKEKKYPDLRGILIPPDKPLVGSTLALSEGGDSVWSPGTGELVAERSVGRGRVTVTAFNLRDRALVAWPHLDGFWNAVLLRRPGRAFVEGEYGAPEVRHPDQEFTGSEASPIYNSGVRIFSRDVAPDMKKDPEQLLPQPTVSDFKLYRQTGIFPRGQSGVAGWNDGSGPALAARRMLREAAGISIPKAGTVVQVLAVYLIALVPVNWLFFKLIGRVEWAWAAAPVIAIVGAFAVVRIAQLDIGFVRSRTEIGVLETSGGYHRGHLTRFIACYTSLSANYDFAFADSAAVAMPFPPEQNYTRRLTETATVVDFTKDVRARLAGYTVRSNSTGIVHSEEMLPLGGEIVLEEASGGYRLRNGAKIVLKDAGVLRRMEDGTYELAKVGEALPETTARLDFQPIANSDAYRGWMNAPAYAGRVAAPEEEGVSVPMGPLLELATADFLMRKGEIRLIAWTDQKLGDLIIEPEASQATFRTLVLVHLRMPPPPEPLLDVNPRSDVIDTKRSTEDELNLFGNEQEGESGEEEKRPASGFPQTSP
ncbi:MAG TPA: hypothetical protein VGN57_20710 [Pirellulaceae bacterium]|jgi:hypothetical protein|nr:hypothetical protein [Pirellulaceae bacterium]